MVVMAQVWLADCGGLDLMLGEATEKFKGKICGVTTPVLKKVPTFLLFLPFWLFIVFYMRWALALDQTAHFAKIGDELWQGNPGINWIPNAPVMDTRSSFTKCNDLCLNTTGCQAFMVRPKAVDTECSISTAAIDPNVRTASPSCTSYVLSSSDPSPPKSTVINSPFVPENQGCSKPLSYGLKLCIIMATVAFLVYWCFFTLPVPAKLAVRFLFFATMFGCVLCGAFIADWVAHDYRCAYVPSADFRTPSQIQLMKAAQVASVCLFLIGLWPSLLCVWFSAGAIVQAAAVGVYCLLTQAQFKPLLRYTLCGHWLIWQEEDLERAKKLGKLKAAPVAKFAKNKSKPELAQEKRTQELERDASGAPAAREEVPPASPSPSENVPVSYPSAPSSDPSSDPLYNNNNNPSADTDNGPHNNNNPSPGESNHTAGAESA